MASRSLRGDVVPKCYIILCGETSAIDSRYSHETTLFDKFVKQIPTIATNPGSSIGANTHSEVSGGVSHTHSGTYVHTHTLTTPPSDSNGVPQGGITPGPCHTHDAQSTSSSAITITVGSTGDSHTHTSSNLEPNFITTRFLKKDNKIEMRHRHLPLNSIIMWPNTLATIPNDFDLESVYNTKVVKGVLNAGTNPGTTGGSSNHQHAFGGDSHTHTVSVPSHGHAWTSPTGGPSGGGGGNVSCGSLANIAHTHTIGTLAVTNASGSGTSATPATHQHASQNNTPQDHELAFIKKKTISIRRPGIPKGGIGLWVALAADVPTNFRIADGNCGTPNLLARYGKGILNDSTDPGTQAGTANHTHTATTHNHPTTTVAHTHTTTGASAGDGVSGGSSQTPPPFTNAAEFNHAHSGTNPASSQPTTTSLSSDGSHSHTATSNDPASIEVAYIQRL